MVEVKEEILICSDCENEISYTDMRRWKYEKSIEVCEDCYSERLLECGE